MSRVIRLTKKQLQEMDSSDFLYLDTDNDRSPSDADSHISVDGKIDDTTSGNTLTADKVANSLTPQWYNRYRSYANLQGRCMREGVDLDNDNVDDFYNHDELDILSNGKDNDNLCKIPQGVERKTDILVDSISQLTAKQQGIVINKILDNVDMSSLPYSWRKELMMKLLSNNQGEIN
jgi:hypothetical protein